MELRFAGPNQTIMYIFPLLRIALTVLFAGIIFTPDAARAAAMQPDTTIAVLELNALIAEARENNPVLRAMRIEAEAMATQPRQVSALPDPTVMAAYRPFAIGGIDGALPSGVQARQMIPYPGKRRLAGQAAEYGAEVAYHEASTMAYDIEYQIKEAFYELYRLQEQDRLIAEFQEQIKGFEEAATVKYEVGSGMQQSILKAQLEKNTLARKRLDIAAVKRDLVARMARLVNRPDLAAQPVLLERPALGFTDPASPEEALSQVPEAAAIRSGMDQAETEIARARNEYLPDFMVGIGFMDMMAMDAKAAPLDNLGKRLSIEAGIVIPLQRGKRDAMLEEARLKRAELDARYEALRTQIETEYNGLKYRLAEEAKAIVMYTDTLIPRAQLTLEATISAYTTGRTDFLDLLDAERMLFDLQMDYEETYASYLKTRAMLERTLGISAVETTSGSQPAYSETYSPSSIR